MQIAFLGIGLMGLPMARRLKAAGHCLYVYNRTREKADQLLADGAIVCASAQEAISRAEVVIFMLTDYKAVQSVFGECESGVFENKTVVQMGTILPEESVDFERRLSVLEAAYLESPVLGSRNEAAQGHLIIMASGKQQVFLDLEDLLSEMGKTVRYVGETGKAAALKLSLNQLIISLIGAFSLSLGIVRKSGVSVDDFMDILRQSALYAPTFDKKLPRILENNFEDPNFPVKHMLKDTGLILKQAESLGLKTAILDSVNRVLYEAKENGLSDKDYSAIYNIICGSS